jgi:hypothetical protein
MKGLSDSGANCWSLCAACARAKTTTTGLAETGAWFASTSDVYAADIGLFHIRPAGAWISIREGATSDIRGRCAQAPGALCGSAVAVVVSGGGIDPVSSSSTTFAIRHLQPPGMT